jgi:hypothetical protein
MSYLIPSQTISEARFRKFPVYEVLAATATALGASAAVAAAAGAVGTAAIGAGVTYGASKLSGGGAGGGAGGGGMPSFDPMQSLQLQQIQYDQMAPQALEFGKEAYAQAAKQGIDFSTQGTQANISNQELVTPGSASQRELALNQLNSYIQGNIPTDVQQNIQRQVAQNLGGGFNLYSGGGQAPQNFARNIGQTSLGLSQYGLSAAPTWQQLANSMVVSPAVGLSAGLQAIGIGSQIAASAAGLGNQTAENQYQSRFNQYQANQLQNQQQQQLGLSYAGMGLQGINSLGKLGYLSNIAQGAQATLGGIPSAYSNQFGSDQMSSAGFYETPQAAMNAGISSPQFWSQGANTGFY